MVEKMSSYLTAFADARGLQCSLVSCYLPVLPLYQGFYPAPQAHGTIVSASRDSVCNEED